MGRHIVCVKTYPTMNVHMQHRLTREPHYKWDLLANASEAPLTEASPNMKTSELV